MSSPRERWREWAYEMAQNESWDGVGHKGYTQAILQIWAFGGALEFGRSLLKCHTSVILATL